MRRSRWAVGTVAMLVLVAACSGRPQTGEATRGRVHAEEHLFYIADDGALPSLPNGSNGLADPGVGERGGVTIHTGIAMGDVWVSVEARRESPPNVDLARWEEVVEVSVRAAGRLQVAALASDVEERFPSLNRGGAGDHRVRVHASGRDHDIDGVDFEPFEEYLLVVWPAPHGPEVAHKQTDRYGDQHRRAASSRG